ncbi:MAG: sigma 54-interacting transcriptional regulator [Alicyclobacillus sp.]|nr:sigma 54-interacting transcriptional regulator [Alicyclobacillus sp.]
MNALGDVVIQSRTMQALFAKARRMAAFPSTILIEGESGVGKEVVANWVHQHSPRNTMPFIKINCASIPESLLESELFGYERGSFTGAKQEGKPGLFELADKGTLLLDEISELSQSMQAKLLRVLQDREVRRVGGSWSRVIDVRILASTNAHLRERVQCGTFREDLYHRLNVGFLHIPPLRSRPEDIEPLLDHYMAALCQYLGITRRLSPEARAALLRYPFPGNIRELRNLLEGLCISAAEEEISPDDLPAYVLTPETDARLGAWANVERGPFSDRIGVEPDGLNRTVSDSRVREPSGLRSEGAGASLQQRLDAYERRLLEEALHEATSIRNAAKRLNVSHSTLVRKLKKYRLHDH